MHGFILGTIKNVSYEAQIRIEDSLSIDNEMMSMGHKMIWIDNVHHMNFMNHEANENDEEINYRLNNTINHRYKCENLKINYLRANIDEIMY